MHSRRTSGVAATLAAATGLLIATALRAEDPPTKVVQSPGGYWSITVPANWSAQAGPEDPNYLETQILAAPPSESQPWIQLQVLKSSPPLEVLIENVRGGLRQRGIALEKEWRDPVNGRAAWQFEWIRVDEQGNRLHIRQGIVEAGTRRVVATTGFPLPPPEGALAGYQEVLSTLEIDEGSPAAATDLAWRAFEEDGLRIELPAGGRLSRAEDGLEVAFDELGVVFVATWRRTSLGTGALLRYDLVDSPRNDPEAPAFEVLETQDGPLGGQPASRSRFYVKQQGVRAMTATMVYRETGPGEVLKYGFFRLGEVPHLDLARWEGCLDRAQAVAHFAPAPTSPPALGMRVDVWAGSASAKLPDGWESSPAYPPRPLPGAPAPRESLLWAAERSGDLGVQFETGRFAGGPSDYQAWLQSALLRLRHAPSLAPARETTVAGKPAWRFAGEYGPPADRWMLEAVVILEQETARSIHARYPVRARDVLGGLVDRVAATLEWKR